jgi:hypothetical protein
MKVATVVVMLTIVILTLVSLKAADSSATFALIANHYGVTLLIFSLTLTWVFALKKIYRAAQRNAKSEPNHGMFKIHGFLMTSYLLLRVFQILLTVGINH